MTEHPHARAIGGSQIGGLMGLNKYLTPAAVYDQIVQGSYFANDEFNRHMDRGNYLEPKAIELYAEATGHDVFEIQPRMDGHRRATPDAGLEEPGNPNPGILETKVPTVHVCRAYRQNGMNPSHYAQTQWYMDILGFDWGVIAVMDPSDWEVFWERFDRDEELIAEMNEVAERFWHDHVLAGVRPTEPAPKDTLERFPKARPGAPVTVDTDEWVAAMQRLKNAREQASLASHRKSLAEDAVKELMGETQEVVVPGIGKVTWKESTSRSASVGRTKEQEKALRKALFEFLRPLVDWPEDEIQSAIDDLADLSPIIKVSASRSFRPTFDE